MMTMKPDIIEKKWRRHDDLAVTVNDAALWYVQWLPTRPLSFSLLCKVIQNIVMSQTGLYIQVYRVFSQIYELVLPEL